MITKKGSELTDDEVYSFVITKNKSLIHMEEVRDQFKIFAGIAKTKAFADKFRKQNANITFNIYNKEEEL